MRRLLADFILESDLCLPKASAPIEVQDRERNWVLTISNLELAPGAISARLAARLAFDHAADMNTARNSANEKLGSALNALVYATSRRFAFVELKRIVDLTPGKVKRDVLIFHTSPADDRMEPSLTSEYADSATRLLAMQSTLAAQATAVRWFRLGVSESNHEQQFNYYLVRPRNCRPGTQDQRKAQ